MIKFWFVIIAFVIFSYIAEFRLQIHFKDIAKALKIGQEFQNDNNLVFETSCPFFEKSVLYDLHLIMR